MVQRYAYEEPKERKMAKFFSGYGLGLSAGFAAEARMLKRIRPEEAGFALERKLAHYKNAAVMLKLDDIGAHGRDPGYTGYRLGVDSVIALHAAAIFAGAVSIRHLLRQ
ncbi:MAG: hypothetical protein ABSE71_03535 [Candidatus Micrarchaeaceae archaeon]|jgi:hypothetical protein|nr:hypothetical protein [Candidatus Micrarchaeota archaeon]HII09848.1 hypothetical protein [Candidatus Micrarchaeota archaeon]